AITVSTFLRENQLAISQKHFGDVNRLVQESAGVITQIEHERGHALRVKTIERVEQFIGGGVVEAACHVDIADTRLQHVRVRNRRLWNSVANNVDVLDT